MLGTVKQIKITTSLTRFKKMYAKISYQSNIIYLLPTYLKKLNV